LYQTTLVVTYDGRSYHGLVVYESSDATLLQTGAATTVRLDDDEIEVFEASAQSLMPQNLLDGITDSELADLDAYLRVAARQP
jgi:hypothetical protein